LPIRPVFLGVFLIAMATLLIEVSIIRVLSSSSRSKCVEPAGAR
jgi:hypothetical protein